MKLGRTSLGVACLLGVAVIGACGKKEGDGGPAPQGSAAASTESAPKGSPAMLAPKPSPSAAPTASSTAHAAPAPKKPTQAEADAMMVAAVAEYKQPKHSCTAVLQKWYGGALYASAEALIPASQAAAHCALDSGNYLALYLVGSMLAHADPTSEKYAYVPRALFHLGKRDEAWKALADLAKKHPGEPGILLLGSYQEEHERRYPAALKLVDSTVKAIHASKDPLTKPLEWRAELLREKAHLFTGDLADAEKDIDAAKHAGAPDDALEEVKKEIVPMKLNKVGVDVTAPAQTYLGIYHLAGKTKTVPDLVQVELMNFTAKD